MPPINYLVVFNLEDQKYALTLSSVKRIIRAVEVTPFPKALETVLGMIMVHGTILPVINVRKRFRLPERDLDLSDRLIIAHTSRRDVVLVVDTVVGVIERSDLEVISADTILPGLEYVQGVTRFEDGMVLIHNLEKFLSFEENEALDHAIRQM